MFENQTPTLLQKIENDLLSSKGISLYIKRDDSIHPEVSGNKWRKLKYNLIDAKAKGYNKVLTFGGAYSNHIAATAAACNEYGFESIGIIRGQELNEKSNTTLQRAFKHGMKFLFVSREQYRNKEHADFLQSFGVKGENLYLIPEGGSNALALKGCEEIIAEIGIDFDYIVTAVGTGGTLSGLACGLIGKQKAIGVSVLKGANYLEEEVHKLIEACSNRNKQNWEIKHDYHLGGYAKSNDELVNFINEFKQKHAILLDPIYTGKMMMALFDMIENDYFEEGSELIALHTGGLQGIEGFNQRSENKVVS